VRVHVVVPEGFDNPGQPSGGNIYDRCICAGLAEAGWDVLVTTVGAAWPVPGPGARADLARIVSAIPDGKTVLIDGIIASPAAAQLLPHTGRIRMTCCCTCHWPPVGFKYSATGSDLRLGQRFPGCLCGRFVLADQATEDLAASDPVEGDRERDLMWIVVGCSKLK